MALPCYPDEERDLDGIIDDELAKAGMTLGMDARRALRGNLGGDRLASRGELEKLMLYAHGRREIVLEDVLATTGDVSALSVDDTVDCVLDGKVDDFDALFTRQSLSGSQAYVLLAATIRQLQALHLMRAGVAEGRTAAAIVAGARPPVFFSRRKTVERAVERWTGEALLRALSRLQAAVLATRRRPGSCRCHRQAGAARHCRRKRPAGRPPLPDTLSVSREDALRRRMAQFAPSVVEAIAPRCPQLPVQPGGRSGMSHLRLCAGIPPCTLGQMTRPSEEAQKTRVAVPDEAADAVRSPAQPEPTIAVAGVILSMALVAVGNGLMFAYIPVRLARKGSRRPGQGRS